jgi:hypothetical protein
MREQHEPDIEIILRQALSSDRILCADVEAILPRAVNDAAALVPPFPKACGVMQ